MVYPINPTVGQIITVGGTRKMWDGVKWKNVTHGNHEVRLQTLEKAPIHTTYSEVQSKYASEVGRKFTLGDLGNPEFTLVSTSDTGGLYLPVSASTKLKYTFIAATARRAIPLQHFGVRPGDDLSSMSNTLLAYLEGEGGDVLLEAGTYQLSASIVPRSNTGLIGQGIGLTLLSSGNLGSLAGMIDGAAERFRANGLSLLGNTDGTNGAGHGINLKGSYNDIRRVFISNTTQAGVRLEDPSYCKVWEVVLESCGRDGYTDNHGIMLFTVGSATLASNEVMHCTIGNTWRKGIATYAPTGSVRGLTLGYNTVYGSGLGNIFVGGPDHRGLDIHHNICTGGAVSLQVQIQDSRIAFNTFDTTSNDFCIGGYDLHNVAILGNTTKGAATCALKVFSPAGELSSFLDVSHNDFRNSNRSSGPSAIVELANTTDSTFSINKLAEDGVGLATYGIYEHSGCDRNLFSRNKIVGVTAADYNVVGANTVVEYADTSESSRGLTVANGDTNDLALGEGTYTLTLVGPTADYRITGIAGGRLGKSVVLVNSTAHNLTLVLNSGASAAGNRIYPVGTTDKVVPPWGAVRLTYISTQGSNFWTDV